MTRRTGRILAAIAVLAMSQLAPADGAGWKEDYEAGLKALNQGDHDKAVALMKQAVAGAEKLGAETNEAARALAGLSEVYLRQKRFTEAGLLLERSLFILAKAPGSNDADVNDVYLKLSRVRISEDRYGEAGSLLNRVLAYREKTPGADFSDVADALEALAGGYLFNKQGFAFATAQSQALELRVRSAESSPRKLAKALLEQADFAAISTVGSEAEAEALRKRALAVQEKALGADHPDVADTLMLLATARLTLSEEGSLYVRISVDEDYDAKELNAKLIALFRENEPRVKRALAIREKAFGPVHPETIKAVQFLAAGYSVMGDNAKAEPYLNRIRSVRKETLGR